MYLPGQWMTHCDQGLLIHNLCKNPHEVADGGKLVVNHPVIDERSGRETTSGAWAGPSIR